MLRDYLFTSESVTEGHPDKMADQISDAILDAFLAHDPQARVAVETCLKTGFALVAGEVTAAPQAWGHVKIPDLIRRTIQDIGYTHTDHGFDAENCGILVALSEQSRDIALGVDAHTNADSDLGAGDQGMMFGYACDDTEHLMPAPIAYAHALTRELARVRHAGSGRGVLYPDGKSQVTVQYEDGRPVRIDAVVISTQHAAHVDQPQIEALVREEVIARALPAHMLDSRTRYFINPTGRFVIGGPKGDAGVTGRKIIVDTYGGMGRHGGGAFSGKDPSKVDRSAAYMGRYVAKNIVAAGLARRAEVQVAYAIGRADPVSVLVETFGTGAVSEETISQAVRAVFGLRPAEIIRTLDLLKPRYLQTAAYGHFGRPEFPWERTDKAEALRAAAGL